MAVSNSEGNYITIYKRTRGESGPFVSKPATTIVHDLHLNYVHGVAFSPCGRILAAAVREGQSVPFFYRCDAESGVFEHEPRQVLTDRGCGLGFPAGLAFHPSGEYLAVANRLSALGVSVHRVRWIGDTFQVQDEAFQRITEADFLGHGLAAPHDVDFSPDGNTLAIIHKRFFKNPSPFGESGISIFRCMPGSLGLESQPSFVLTAGLTCLHSIAWDPAGSYIAVSDEQHDVAVYEWSAETRSLRCVNTISIDAGGNHEGPKGVAFTSDGACLAVTTVLDEVLFFRNWDKTTPPLTSRAW